MARKKERFADPRYFKAVCTIYFGLFIRHRIRSARWSKHFKVTATMSAKSVATPTPHPSKNKTLFFKKLKRNL